MRETDNGAQDMRLDPQTWYVFWFFVFLYFTYTYLLTSRTFLLSSTNTPTTAAARMKKGPNDGFIVQALGFLFLLTI